MNQVLKTQTRKTLTPIERITKAQVQHYYIRIKSKNGSLTQGDCMISGYTNYWGTGLKANPQFVYIPGLRIAGSYNDVATYISQLYNDNTTDRTVLAQFVQRILNCHLSATNYNKPIQMEAVNFQNGQVSFYNTTSKELFDREIAEYATYHKAQGPVVELMSLKSLMNEVNATLIAVGETPEGVEAASKTKSKSGMNIRETLQQKVKETSDTKAFNVSAFEASKAVGGSTGGARLITNGVPQKGTIRLGSQGTPLYNTYFQVDKGTRGATEFLISYGYSGQEAEQIVKTAASNYNPMGAQSFVGKLSMGLPQQMMQMPQQQFVPQQQMQMPQQQMQMPQQQFVPQQMQMPQQQMQMPQQQFAAPLALPQQQFASLPQQQSFVPNSPGATVRIPTGMTPARSSPGRSSPSRALPPLGTLQPMGSLGLPSLGAAPANLGLGLFTPPSNNQFGALGSL